MKYLSLFSGIGGFEIGIQNAFEASGKTEQTTTNNGHLSYDTSNTAQERRQSATCIGYSEIDKYAIKVYERRFNGHRNYGDITTIDPVQLPDFDLVVGGFPCQAFSVAGKRLGFNETRGTLFFDIARIFKHKRPGHFLLENVKGLLTHDSGKTFQTILGVLTDLGYYVEWQVLNAKDFGVPQNRERVFIVGHLGDRCGRQIFPIFGDHREDSSIEQSEVSGTIDTGYAKNYQQSGATYVKQIGQIYDNPYNSQAGRVYASDGVSPTLDVMGGGNRQPKVAIPVLTPDRLEKRQNGRRFKTDGEPSFTLNTQDKHGIYDGARIRRLTPKECERLMGFPDDWTKYDRDGNTVSDTQRYKMCGNAVVTNVVEAVITGLINHKTKEHL